MENSVNIEVNEIVQDYNKLGLKWNTNSIRYLIGKGYEGLTKTFNSLRVPDPINTLGLVECAMCSKDKADAVIETWTSKGYGLALLHILIVEALREQGFFKSEREMEIIMSLTAQRETMKAMGSMILTEELQTQIQTVSSLTQ